MGGFPPVCMDAGCPDRVSAGRRSLAESEFDVTSVRVSPGKRLVDGLSVCSPHYVIVSLDSSLFGDTMITHSAPSLGVLFKRLIRNHCRSVTTRGFIKTVNLLGQMTFDIIFILVCMASTLPQGHQHTFKPRDKSKLSVSPTPLSISPKLLINTSCSWLARVGLCRAPAKDSLVFRWTTEDGVRDEGAWDLHHSLTSL